MDEHGPTHGHGVGLSVGWVSVLWVTHLLSAGDHRLKHVAPWAAQRLHPLRTCTGQPVHPLERAADRLAGVLEAWRDETRGSACAGALQQHARRVYDRPPAGVRLDTTTATGPWPVTADGLWPCGHSKDQRPDLPPVQIMVSALDPLGMPVATDVVPGPRADDPRYIPAITRVRAGLGRRGLLDGGAGNMGALDPRAVLHAGGDPSVCPLSESQLPPALWASYLAPVGTAEPAVTLLHRAPPGGTSQRMAEGCERVEPVTAAGAGHRYRWQERRVGIRSCQLAQAGERGLRGRLAQAPAAITALQTRGRGWRRWADPRALPEAVLAYRHAYLVARAMGRLKGRPVSLTPRARAREDHAPGWIRRLSLGVRVLTRLDCGVRRRVATAKTTLAGLHVGHPTRATAHPPAERLWEAFPGLTLAIIREGRRRRRHLTPLSRVPHRMLARLAFPVAISMRLCPASHTPP